MQIKGHYAGIGSRETPEEIQQAMVLVSNVLMKEGWVLRTGGAEGADSAFEFGASSRGMTELYLPWRGFNGRLSVNGLNEPTIEAMELSSRFHPAWERLSDGGRKLHGRNAHQILGKDVTDPAVSRFVICWTPKGMGSGGTGQALRIARHYEVPIFDLAKPEAYERVMAMIASD
jgi:hypothetical protein